MRNCWKAKNSGGQEEQEVGDVEKDEGASLIDPDVKKDSSDVESRLGVEMQPCKPEGLNSSGQEAVPCALGSLGWLVF